MANLGCTLSSCIRRAYRFASDMHHPTSQAASTAGKRPRAEELEAEMVARQLTDGTVEAVLRGAREARLWTVDNVIMPGLLRSQEAAEDAAPTAGRPAQAQAVEIMVAAAREAVAQATQVAHEAAAHVAEAEAQAAVQRSMEQVELQPDFAQELVQALQMAPAPAAALPPQQLLDAVLSMSDRDIDEMLCQGPLRKTTGAAVTAAADDEACSSC